MLIQTTLAFTIDFVKPYVWLIILSVTGIFILVVYIKEYTLFEHFRCKAIKQNGSLVYGEVRRHKKRNTYEFHESGRKYNLLDEKQSRDVKQSRQRLIAVSTRRKLKTFEVPRFNLTY